VACWVLDLALYQVYASLVVFEVSAMMMMTLLACQQLLVVVVSSALMLKKPAYSRFPAVVVLLYLIVVRASLVLESLAAAYQAAVALLASVSPLALIWGVQALVTFSMPYVPEISAWGPYFLV